MSALKTGASSSIKTDERKSFARLTRVSIPDLVKIQISSFAWFKDEGLKQLFKEVSPIKDFTEKKLELSFGDFEFRPVPHKEEVCYERELTYAAPLYVKAQLLIKETGEISEQEIFFGDFPLMTERGTFIISGAERVVVSQLIRSPGVYYTLEEDLTSGRSLCLAKLIPEHGAWLEFETTNRGVIYVKLNGKRKIPVTTLLRAMGHDTDAQLKSIFNDIDNTPDYSYISKTIEQDPQVRNRDEALIEIYRKLRPGEMPNIENARDLLKNLFFNARRYDLGKIGRHKLNRRLGLDKETDLRTLTPDDFVQIVRHIINVNNGQGHADDIDHLGNRRVRTVGPLIQNQFRIGLLRLERAIKERMSIINIDAATPSALVNVRPVIAAMREFFGGSQLSQFMDQTNPLAELTHKRRLSAMGPGGLSRERAGFDVRDVHHSHYGRICPIETPEGPNIGLIGSLATHARINEFGLIETPYRKVIKELPASSKDILGRTLNEDISDKKHGLNIVRGSLVDTNLAKKISEFTKRKIKVVPYVSEIIEYQAADEEEEYTIAQANAILNEKNEFGQDKVEVRRGSKYFQETADHIDFMDLSPEQVFSVAASLIPFLEHDDANRALMGANMQRQAVPLIKPQAPLIATGMEREVAKYSGQLVSSKYDGVVTSVTSSEIKVKDTKGHEHQETLKKFMRTNQGTCINQHPIVNKGDKIKCGDTLADSSATDQGELALGQNVICAFMSWHGYNFEDAIIISERLVKDDKYTSIHIEKYEIEARDTKLGNEEITRDIPNVSEESLKDLDEYGIVRIGAEVGPGDILVGKITPKGETELTAEEKLLRAIFGEKAREVKDSSLRVPHGEWGKVIDVKVFSRGQDKELAAGVNKLVRVRVAQKRKVTVGDKMAGRHGNKGVISVILPEEDMPILPDGRPVDIVLNPIGVPSRMNIGQVMETHLGWVAHNLKYRVHNPIFDGANDITIEDGLGLSWLVERAHDFGPIFGDWATVQNRTINWLNNSGFDGEAIFNDRNPGEAMKACLKVWLGDEAALAINEKYLGKFEELDTATNLGDEERGREAERIRKQNEQEVKIERRRISNLDDNQVTSGIEDIYKQYKKVPPIFGKVILRDGLSGEPFDQPITVGNIYMMKLIHLVEDKIHARSTGPYSLITQQPLGGKAQFGGQRFGEMEVWALEAYGAAHILQELLTVKSDDISGRAKTYEAIVKGEDIIQPGVPESFKVLFMELRSLGLAVELLNDEEKISFLEEEKKNDLKVKF